jgi:hypothetical protein
MEKHIYRGKLSIHDTTGEDDEILCLDVADGQRWIDDEQILARHIEEDIETYGSYLSVRYFISNVELDEDALITDWLNHLEGVGNAEYGARYSEITGYLFTDEDLNVGGHDLLEELKTYVGQYLNLEIEYSHLPLKHPTDRMTN